MLAAAFVCGTRQLFGTLLALGLLFIILFPTMKQFFLAGLLFCQYIALDAQNVQVSVQIFNNRKPVSPYIYGRNNSVTDFIGNPVSASNWQLYKDAGVNFFRENGGNNLTKHNWKLNISSHPDWYNNVYTSNWDYAAQTLHQNIPSAQGMWGFQLIGKAASTNANNFNDWAYNNSQWWSGVNQNLAGGGVVNTAGGSQAQVNGDPNQYLQNWNEDSTTDILKHWFGSGGLGLDSTKIRYWNMDNEPDIWSGTHDDVMPVQPSAESFMQRYFAVAKKARALFPGIKLTGPVCTTEWQWFNWGAAPVTGSDGKQYPWLQYFIKRVAEEEQSSGIRLLDVIDLHFYPSSTSPSNVVQYHRVFFDSTYNFPEANGVKVVNGGWDNSIQIVNIFGRCQKWLNQYMGTGHGVTFAVSETGTQLQNDPNALAVWYASMMGEFMNHGVEFFSPWNWEFGMWETVHLFSRYNKSISVQATSSDEQNVSAYTTVNNNNDSVTIALVNRSQSQSKTVVINFPDFLPANQAVQTLTLSSLPVGTETFVSHSNNALQLANISPQNNTLQVTLAPMSITSLIVTGMAVALPQNLLSFTASKTGNKVVLNFTATNELDVVSFDVERSADGSSFTTIGTVTGKGANGQYTFIDAQPLPSMNYYRLKMITHNGDYSYSKIVPIRYDKNASITIFPNPVKDVVNVQLQMPTGAVTLQIIDGMGRRVKTMTLRSSGSTLSTAIDVSGLAAGQYYIHAGSENISFIKQQ
jgi:hypothetical protein